uniref:peptide-methionine (S)-S-oxide reductase n=1 Tax=Alexandrium monilatum TaxID=311494 RepID=A0A7S4SI79_9DINO
MEAPCPLPLARPSRAAPGQHLAPARPGPSPQLAAAAGPRAAAAAEARPQPRRDALLAFGAFVLAGAGGRHARVARAEVPAASSAAVAVFSAGDARFLQAAFEDIRYRGISAIEVGRMLADGTRAVRVTYNPARCSYKALLGAYLRNTNPTQAAGQFDDKGPAFRPVIWVSSDAERELAEKAIKLMEGSGVFGPPVEKGKLVGGTVGKRQLVPFATEIANAGDFQPVPEDGQDFYKLKRGEYKELFKRSGRERFFKDQFDPVSTTACQDRVCGFVYFPCTAENRCMDVANGSW